MSNWCPAADKIPRKYTPQFFVWSNITKADFSKQEVVISETLVLDVCWVKVGEKKDIKLRVKQVQKELSHEKKNPLTFQEN